MEILELRIKMKDKEYVQKNDHLGTYGECRKCAFYSDDFANCTYKEGILICPTGHWEEV